MRFPRKTILKSPKRINPLKAGGQNSCPPFLYGRIDGLNGEIDVILCADRHYSCWGVRCRSGRTRIMNVNDYYPLMIPPIIKDFKELSKAETKQYFDWYVSQSDTRINQLQHYIADSGSPEVVLDGTPESFVPLWRWFENNIQTEKKSEEEMEAEMVGRPEWMRKEIRKVDWKFTVMTYALAVDIAFYFAKVFIDHNNCIRWGYYTKPKNRSSVNRPVLLGFRNNLDLDPREIVIVCCRKSLEEKKETRLLDVYNCWVKYIE